MVRRCFGSESEMLSNTVEANRDMVSKEQSCHGQCASEHPRMDVIMVPEDESVELRMVMDKEHIGPVLFLQDIGELALVVPLRGRRLVPFYRGAVGFEPRVSAIAFRRHFRQRVVVTEI